MVAPGVQLVTVGARHHELLQLVLDGQVGIDVSRGDEVVFVAEGACKFVVDLSGVGQELLGKHLEAMEKN